MMIEKISLTPVSSEIESSNVQFKNSQINTSLSDEPSQFEAVYLQTVLKSSCIEQHFVSNDGFSDEAERNIMYPGSHTNFESTPLTLTTPGIAPIEADTLPACETKNEFIAAIWPYAQKASALIGLDPKLLIAQAALETGWGQFVAKGLDGVSSNNLFNIKSNDSNHGDTVRTKTTEYVNGEPVKMTDSFKKYPSLSHSFDDYISLIKGSERYHVALSHVDDPEAYVHALHQAGYATDPAYTKKILSIYHGEELKHALDIAGILS